jgi:hypothetical protein
MGDPEKNVYGISPLGGNSVEGTASGMAEVRDTSVQGVPLFWDERVNQFISEQAIEELDDRDISLERAEDFEREESFRQRVGFRKTVPEEAEVSSGSGWGFDEWGTSSWGSPS